MIQDEIVKQKRKLRELRRKGIEKLNILTLLQHDSNAKTKQSNVVPTDRIDIKDFEDDLRRLRAIIANQSEEMCDFEENAKTSSALEKRILEIKDASKLYQIQARVQTFVRFYMPHMGSKVCEALVNQIASHFTAKAETVPSEGKTFDLTAIIEDLEMILPTAIVLHAGQTEFAHLVRDIEEICRDVRAPEGNQCSFKQLIEGALMEAKELVPADTLNYSDVFLADVLHTLLGYCDVNELSGVEHVRTIAAGLRNLLAFYPMQVNASNVVRFVRRNEPTVDATALRSLLESVLTESIMAKYHFDVRIPVVDASVAS